MKKIYEVARCVSDCLFGETYTLALFTKKSEAEKLREYLRHQHPDWNIIIREVKVFDSVKEYLDFWHKLRRARERRRE